MSKIDPIKMEIDLRVREIAAKRRAFEEECRPLFDALRFWRIRALTEKAGLNIGDTIRVLTHGAMRHGKIVDIKCDDESYGSYEAHFIFAEFTKGGFVSKRRLVLYSTDKLIIEPKVEAEAIS